VNRLITEKTKNYLQIFGILVGLSGFYYALDAIIDKRISDKLKDYEVIKQIASLVRPTCVFDHKKRIILDSGVQQIIEDIEVVPQQIRPKQILIRFKEHLNVPPLLECINYNCTISAERKNKSDWLFTLSSPKYIKIDSPKIEESLYRLEIFK
jgi:hypothetical protein